jgi:glucosamine 6-phosphate synthetase-like amidotransferase/phosphosugar isomerase protein
MCGIFGIVSNQRFDPAQFRVLGGLNTVRGNRAFGVLTLTSDGQLHATRQVAPFQAERLDQVALNDVSIALGHVRAPTDGRADDPAAVHPFQTHDLWLAHNGLLLNHADFASWRPTGAAPIDSTVIIGGIQQQLDRGLSICNAIQYTVEPLDGQQACWLWHVPSGLIYLWRVMSPIYVAPTTHSLSFSSIRTATADQLLNEGVIYQIDPSAISLSAVGAFAYHNPFQRRT